jgi:hypothetical protein
MTYTLISTGKRDAGAIIGTFRSWDDVVRHATFTWMVGRRVKDVILWCKQYRISWRVEL